MHMTKEEILIKRFNSLVGKIPIPRLNTDVEKEAYISLFELNESVTVEYVKSILFPFHLQLDEHDLGKYSSFGEVEKALFILDNVEVARDYCKRHFTVEK